MPRPGATMPRAVCISSLAFIVPSSGSDGGPKGARLCVSCARCPPCRENVPRMRGRARIANRPLPGRARVLPGLVWGPISTKIVLVLDSDTPMLRISRLTDYATVLLGRPRRGAARLQTATALAEQTHIAAPTVSKLLKQLQRSGLVTSTRGLHGGYQLARPARADQCGGDPRRARRARRPHRLLGRPRALRDRGQLPGGTRLAAPEPRHPPRAE